MRRVDEIRIFRMDGEIARKKESIFALEQEVSLQRLELNDLERRRDELKANAENRDLQTTSHKPQATSGEAKP